MNKYILYWNGSEPEILIGSSVASAFINAGYSGGALAALDYYAEEKEGSKDYNLSDEALIEKHRV